MSDLTAHLTSSLRPGLVGLNAGEFKTRLNDWLLTAEKELPNTIAEPKKSKALGKYVTYLYYQDAVNHHLDTPQTVDVKDEGSVDMGDWSARLRGLERARDQALEDFQNLLLEPPKVVNPNEGKASFFMPNEYVW